jgi:hypothetical protein
MLDSENQLLITIQALNETAWSQRVGHKEIEEWLKGFGAVCSPNSIGRCQALYLLSRFIYFNGPEIRALLRALFRDHFRYPIIATARRNAANTRDTGVLDAIYQHALRSTRFLGMGNPSESGTHLLYFYRQENKLPQSIFINAHEIFDLHSNSPTLANPNITRYIFIDDFCGSAQQVIGSSSELVQNVRNVAANAGVPIRIEYHVLIATRSGIARIKNLNRFDDVVCVLNLDESYKTFGSQSRYFGSKRDSIGDKTVAESIATFFGAQLLPSAPLGYDDGQLMLGFVHNTPDNTLPIFWHPGNATMPWNPVFRRYPKF